MHELYSTEIVKPKAVFLSPILWVYIYSEPMCDFLLVFHCSYMLIFYRFLDITTLVENIYLL